MENGNDSGHFRILFLGYRASGSPADGPCSAEDPAASWEDATGEDERAYFQADISWISLGGGGAPQEAALTAMITGDVRGLRKRSGPGESRSPEAGGLPLSLGTYALVPGRNAVAIGNPAVLGALRPDPAPSRDRAVAGIGASGRTGMQATVRLSGPQSSSDACVLDLPLTRPSRTRILFLTFETASGLAAMDQGFGKGVFTFAYRDDADPHRETILYFRLDRL